jgi:isoquinoline 1-oxidoreductase subunit alpha
MPLTLKINGVEHALPEDLDPATPLLWVLRDTLGLVGTKYGCGRGLCGACTVHLNGTAMRSCVFPVVAAASARITTIEGLSPDASHPLQKAWCELDVPQCGYCQAGQIMNAAALLATNPAPDDTAIDESMNGNLCRCGTYPRIRAGIKLAASLMASTGKEAAK